MYPVSGLTLNVVKKLRLVTKLQNTVEQHKRVYAHPVSIRSDLEQLAEEQRTLPDRRAQLVAAARNLGMTWREIAIILDMTEQGIIKADKAWRERHN